MLLSSTTKIFGRGRFKSSVRIDDSKSIPSVPMVTVELDMLEDELSDSVFSGEDDASSTSGDAGISGGELGNARAERLCEPQSMLVRRCRSGFVKSSVSMQGVQRDAII